MDTQEATRSQEEGRGILILVLGILSVASLGPILGIPAWIMGKTDLAKIDEGRIPASERQLTKAGMILGIVGTFYVLVALFIVFLIFILLAPR